MLKLLNLWLNAAFGAAQRATLRALCDGAGIRSVRSAGSGCRSNRLKDVISLTGKISLVLGVAISAGAMLSPAKAGHVPGPVVQTQEGPVQGFFDEGVAKFLGIPYAAPPVSTNPSAPACATSNLRWCPPVAHARWSTLLQATSFGSNCPQNDTLGTYAGPVNTTDENCLFINVYTPSVGAFERGRKFPVIFFMHGGGNFDGESNDYDGSKMAVKGHVVVVTINYRLGALGWLAAPALDSEGHLFANYGLLDQQFALKWVQRNIAKFGGNPDNITVGGQSTGSEDTEANVVSPLAKGLFQRAIFMSDVDENIPSLAEAEADSAAFVNGVGCKKSTNAEIAACLRALSVAQILALPSLTGLPYPYTADGTILPLAPTSTAVAQRGALSFAFESGHYNHMPIMSGTTEDEETFFLAADEYSTQQPYSAAQYQALISGFPTTVTPFTAPLTVQAWVAKHFPLTSATPPGPELSEDALYTPQTTCAQRRINKLIATGPSPSPVYAYEFDDRTAPFYMPAFKFPFESLAYHTGDIQYVFGNPSGTVNFHGGPAPPSVVHPFNRVQKVLSDQMVAAWTNFAWTGNPNWRGDGPNSTWPRYWGNASNSYYFLEDVAPKGLTTVTDAQFVAKHHCDFWDSLAP
jgi:para-nitrobenzyl esterase